MSALAQSLKPGSNFNSQNTQYISVAKIFAFLDLDKI